MGDVAMLYSTRRHSVLSGLAIAIWWMAHAARAAVIEVQPAPEALSTAIAKAAEGDTVVVEGNHYFPESAVQRQYLMPSNTRTTCAWKGVAHYHNLLVDGDANPDAVWYYPEPKEAAAEIRGRVAFWKGVQVRE